MRSGDGSFEPIPLSPIHVTDDPEDSNSDANLIRCASPPERVVDCCPKVMYPNPTSLMVFSLLCIFGGSRVIRDTSQLSQLLHYPHTREQCSYGVVVVLVGGLTHPQHRQ